ncbi:SMI1/KNR4 family protein [Sphaerotilus sp.]|uniref:SMI1/KNR4 family protein n=1 Tax=Sphaerotilus sp. TaxID=2093942 RepID=UPI0034E2DFCB
MDLRWPLLDDLNPPATDADIAALAQQLGATLPADYVQVLQQHNGQRGLADGLFDGQEFLSTQNVFAQWQIWQQLHDAGRFKARRPSPAPGVRGDWWNPRWIPFTHDGSGNHRCIDLAPAEGGTVGQVITVWHDTGERALEGASFGDWFTRWRERSPT